MYSPILSCAAVICYPVLRYAVLCCAIAGWHARCVAGMLCYAGILMASQRRFHPESGRPRYQASPSGIVTSWFPTLTIADTEVPTNHRTLQWGKITEPAELTTLDFNPSSSWVIVVPHRGGKFFYQRAATTATTSATTSAADPSSDDADSATGGGGSTTGGGGDEDEGEDEGGGGGGGGRLVESIIQQVHGHGFEQSLELPDEGVRDVIIRRRDTTTTHTSTGTGTGTGTSPDADPDERTHNNEGQQKEQGKEQGQEEEEPGGVGMGSMVFEDHYGRVLILHKAPR